MRDVEAHPLHSFDHRRRRCRRRDEAAHFLRDAVFHFVGRVDQHRVNDRGAAIMRDVVCANRIENRLCFDAAQADVRACVRGHRPRKAPAVAMEHRQRPQINGMARHAPVDDVRERIQVRAAVMVDDALRIAGRARRVVERDRVPFVGRQLPGKFRIAVGDEGLVVHFAKTFAARARRIDNVDDGWLALEPAKSLGDRRRELGIGDEDFRLAMLEHERDRFRIEPRVERVQHAARHRHAEVAFVHFRCVGQHHRDRVVLADADTRKRRGEPSCARIGFAPRVTAVPVDDGEPLRPDVRRARDQRQRRQRCVIRRLPAEIAFVDRGSRHGSPMKA